MKTTKPSSGEQSLSDWAAAWKDLIPADVTVVPDPSTFDVVEWRIKVLSYRDNLARESLDEAARMAFIMQGAAAAAAGYELLRSDLRNGIDEAELRSNHITLTHLAAVLSDGLLAAMAALAEHEGQAAAELRQAASTLGRIAAAKRNESDPKRIAMAEIRNLWERMQAGEGEHMSDAKFARSLWPKYHVLTSDQSIKNAISKWRKDRSSS